MDTKALRQKILDLAIRGKLVPQDPNDEPASVLLERIRAQKKQMVKEGKLKAKDIKNDTVIFVGEDNLHYEKFQDGSVKCIEDEIPFEIPRGWEWARMNTLVVDLPYGTSKKSHDTGDVAVIRMGNLQNGEIDFSELVYSSDMEDIERYSLSKGDLLFNRTNSIKLVGKTSIYRGDIPAIFAGYLIRIRTQINSNYLNAVMNSQYVRKLCAAVRTDAVNQSNINASKLGQFLLPIPGQAEQDRIAKTLQSILLIIDQTVSDIQEIKSLVIQVKSCILDLAIRGKLVQQDPNDEPASVLLERIHAEKEELIKQSKIKRDKKEAVIFKGEDNSYYETVPTNWGEVSLSDIAEIELGKTLDTEKNTGEMFPYLRSVNILWNNIDLSDIKEMKFEPDEFERFSVRKGDLLICEGGDVGRCSVWRKEETIFYQNALHRVRFYGNCDAQFFVYAILYLESIGYLKQISNGVTIKHLTKSILIRIPFLLPPLAEQHRIVTAIETYFSTLDKISSCLA